MTVLENISLKNYNTFGIDVNAKRFISINSVEELQQLLSKEKDLFLISGGSNMLLTKDIEKLVIHINIKGISIENEDDNFIEVTVNAGENIIYNAGGNIVSSAQKNVNTIAGESITELANEDYSLTASNIFETAQIGRSSKAKSITENMEKGQRNA